MSGITLDLNDSEFQDDWFALDRTEAFAVLQSLDKIRRMDWDQLYRDPGLRWEAIRSRKGPEGERVYSLRMTRKARAVAFRTGDKLRFLSLHFDHDSAY